MKYLRPYNEESYRLDVEYLRSRNRWTQELEDELIQLHKDGTPPDICEFGVTEETQMDLMKAVVEEYRERSIEMSKPVYPEEFEFPFNHRLVLSHMNKEDARRWIGEEDQWHATITRAHYCDSCTRGKDIAWFKGHGTTSTEAIAKAVLKMKEYDELIRGMGEQKK